MPAFTFTGKTPRYYPALGVTARPGDKHEFAVAPDSRWQKAVSRKANPHTDDPTPEETA